jgi:hypothetical protein
LPFNKAVFAAIALTLAGTAVAGDSPFGYVYTTDTHPKGKKEIEQWITHRAGQSRGDYSAWLFRTELEYGVTDNLQTALYLNYDRVNAFQNKPDGTTGPGAFVPDGIDPDARYRNSFFESISNEWIYRVLSPYKDPIGLAFYIEPTYGPKKRELEGKIILQKNFLDDRLIWAANLTAAREKEKFHGEWEKESELEFTTGLAYQFAPRWHGGVEYRNHRGYEGYGFSKDKRSYSANFIGPSVHYSDRAWWVTATFLTQLGNAKGYTDAAREDITGGRFYGEHHERHELRIKVGFNF